MQPIAVIAHGRAATTVADLTAEHTHAHAHAKKKRGKDHASGLDLIVSILRFQTLRI